MIPGISFRKSKIIDTNPFESVDSVTHRRKNGNALTIEQQRRFIELIDGHELKNLYLVYLMTGCRRQEALDLKWSDVDFKTKQLHIRGTKTVAADRTIPLFPQVEKLLKAVPKDNAYIFPYTANKVHCHFARLKAKYKLPYRIHDLRHTFITRCLQAKIDAKIIQRWSGHSRLDTTMNVYAHVQSDFEREEVSKYNPRINFKE